MSEERREFYAKAEELFNRADLLLKGQQEAIASIVMNETDFIKMLNPILDELKAIRTNLDRQAAAHNIRG
jgi:hypothetical protein